MIVKVLAWVRLRNKDINIGNLQVLMRLLVGGKVMGKIRNIYKMAKNKKQGILLVISVLAAIIFVLSPVLLRCKWFNSGIDFLLEPLKYSAYKEAFIGAVGGMIGSFLAITGALWVEKSLTRENDKKEIEKAALIIYYDIAFFYKEISDLAMNMGWILGIPDKDESKQKFNLYKNYIGIHIHAEWISLVAILKDVLTVDELKNIYDFYGKVSDVKIIIEKGDIADGNMGRVNQIINSLGMITENEFVANVTYQNILDKLKDISG